MSPSQSSGIRPGLVRRWRDESNDSEDLLSWLLEKWTEPHRRYHDLRHLHECLDALDGLGGGRPERLAAWFHDVVYDGVPVQDEKRSAELSRARLTGLGCAPELIHEVERLVLLTIEHDPSPGDAAGEILSDADLAILGATPQRYRESVADIRWEYARFDEEQWRVGRAQVLRSFLARPRIYRTELGHARWEESARANIGRELAAL